MEYFFSYPINWSAVAAIGQSIATIMAITALIYSVRTYKKSMQSWHYSELDAMYMSLLKTSIENPRLSNSKLSRSDEEQIQYDIYAFMVWNFLESVFDLCEKDKQLSKTWYPVIESENKKHRDWFDKKENILKFKKTFYQFIQANGFDKIVKTTLGST